MMSLTNQNLLIILPLSNRYKSGNYRPDSAASSFYGACVTRANRVGVSFVALGRAGALLFFVQQLQKEVAMQKHSSSSLKQLCREVDTMILALILHIRPDQNRSLEPERIKIYSDHIVYLLGKINRMRHGGAR